MPVACAEGPFRSTTAAKLDAGMGEWGFGEAMIDLVKDVLKSGRKWPCHKTTGDDGETTVTTRECWGSPRYRRAVPIILAREHMAQDQARRAND